MKEIFIMLGIMFVATILAAFGSIFMKKGSANIVLRFHSDIVAKNKFLIAGLFLYGLGAIANILAYKFGNFSVVFPLTALAYIWSLFLARVYLDEPITIKKVIGISIIMLGIVLVVI